MTETRNAEHRISVGTRKELGRDDTVARQPDTMEV